MVLFMQGVTSYRANQDMNVALGSRRSAAFGYVQHGALPENRTPVVIVDSTGHPDI